MNSGESVKVLKAISKSWQNSYSDKPRNFFNGKPLQTKLTVNEPGDAFEKKADQVAENIIQNSSAGNKETFFSTSIAPATIQRSCAACEEEKLHRKETSPAIPMVTPSVEQTLSSPGNAMDAGTKNFMESRFGSDFSGVRIHNDAIAHRSSADIRAKAYTNGNYIVFRNGEYNPSSNSGKQLLAHELTHVMQQRLGTSSGHKLHRAPVPQKTCPFDSVKQKELLNKPLPWGIQAGDSLDVIETKKKQMQRDPDFLSLLNNCIYKKITGYVFKAEDVLLQEILDGIDSNRPFILKRRTSAGRMLEAIADPRPLPGSGVVVDDLKYIVNGGDASVDNTITMPGVTTPQCCDNCKPAERLITLEQFMDTDSPVRSCCSPQQCSIISDRLQVADSYTNRTITRLGGGSSMDNAISRHFGKSDTNTYKDVLRGLESIQPDIEFSRHPWVCRERGNAGELCTSLNRARKNIGGRAQTRGWRIQLCFKNGDMEWSDILHEVTHTAFASGAETYMGDKEPGQHYPPDNALNNADSYAMFVKEVGDPNWKEEQHVPLSISGLTGFSFRNRRIRSVYGVHAELTPTGPGMRVYDFVAGGTILWSPASGQITDTEDAGAKLELGVDAMLRVRPKRSSIYLDAGVGALLKLPDAGLEIDPRLSASWKPGGGSSGLKFTVDLRAVYNELQVAPNNFIFTVGIGYDSGGEPHHRLPMTNP